MLEVVMKKPVDVDMNIAVDVLDIVVTEGVTELMEDRALGILDEHGSVAAPDVVYALDGEDVIIAGGVFDVVSMSEVRKELDVMVVAWVLDTAGKLEATTVLDERGMLCVLAEAVALDSKGVLKLAALLGDSGIFDKSVEVTPKVVGMAVGLEEDELVDWKENSVVAPTKLEL